MPYDQFYLRPRKMMVHPYYGDTVVCEDHDGSQHKHSRRHRSADHCEECGDMVVVCDDCRRAVSCCRCGNYHSTDCPWPL